MNRELFEKELATNCIAHFITHSDAGGVLIGNENVSFIVSNGQGDGITKVYVTAKFEPASLEFFTSVEGDKIQIHEYDCDLTSKVMCTLSGRYGIHAGYGYIVFVKWD